MEAGLRRSRLREPAGRAVPAGASAPQAVINLLDLVFDMPDAAAQARDRQRLRSINGQTDPDSKPTPEQEAAAAEKRAVAKAQFEAQMAKLIADVQEAQAKGAKLRSEAVLARLTSVYEAAQAATVIASMPGVAPVADELLKTAGFEDQGADDTMIDTTPPAAAAPVPNPGIDPVAPEQGVQPMPA